MKLKLPPRYHRIGIGVMPARHPLGGDFDKYQQKNYQREPVDCLCNSEDSGYVISNVDREGWKYTLLACQFCGLIRAEHYWNEASVADFYSNWYRDESEADADRLYERQAHRSNFVKTFIDEHSPDRVRRLVVFDIGGGAGGLLNSFLGDAKCYLVDYGEDCLRKAESMGIATQAGGINNIDRIAEYPDLVLLSHVLEHFTDVSGKIKALISRLRVGALVYIELPGIDSLSEGRRKHDFLRDIHIPHVFYFSRDVLNNFMHRLGFECLHSNSEIQALYRYSGRKGELINYHDHVCSLIKKAEIKRRFHVHAIKKAIAFVLPRWIKQLLKN